MRGPAALRIGLVSDTHGMLRPAVLSTLRGCDHIIHGGDIGTPQILDALRDLAPLTAVRGNNDVGAWAERLNEVETLEFQAVRVHVLHDLKQLNAAPHGVGFRVVISGHSHKPQVEQRAATLFVNPGSAGPRRFKLPISVGEMIIEGKRVEARIIELEEDGRHAATSTHL